MFAFTDSAQASPWNMRGAMVGGTEGQVTCAVQLIDRRTGSALRVNGRPLVLFTRDPQAASAELLEGRDPDNWETRIEPLQPGATK